MSRELLDLTFLSSGLVFALFIKIFNELSVLLAFCFFTELLMLTGMEDCESFSYF